MELNEELGRKEGEVAQAKRYVIYSSRRVLQRRVCCYNWLFCIHLFRLHSPCHKNLNLDCILVAHSGFHLTRNQPYGGEPKVLKMSDWSRRGSRQRLGKAGRGYGPCPYGPGSATSKTLVYEPNDGLQAADGSVL